MARLYMGEREGMQDMRRALELALAQGQSGTAAVLHNNLAIGTWQYEGPQRALVACLEGIDFCERRGIAELALGIASMRPTFLAEIGHTGQALAETGPLADRLEAAGDITFVESRAVQLRQLAERGAHEGAPPVDAILAAVRESGAPQVCALAFTAVAQLLRRQGRPQDANAVLAELTDVPGVRADHYYTSALAQNVRTALALQEPELAVGLTEGVSAGTPMSAHALIASRAQLAEAAGEHREAAALYAHAADGWRDFGNVPERAYALLGQGRCLRALDDAAAAQPLSEARELFADMGYRPAVAEADALLAGLTQPSTRATG
jgi:hypothetical protein